MVGNADEVWGKGSKWVESGIREDVAISFHKTILRQIIHVAKKLTGWQSSDWHTSAAQTDWLTEWLTDWLNDWLTDWLTDWPGCSLAWCLDERCWWSEDNRWHLRCWTAFHWHLVPCSCSTLIWRRTDHLPRTQERSAWFNKSQLIRFECAVEILNLRIRYTWLVTLKTLVVENCN